MKSLVSLKGQAFLEDFCDVHCISYEPSEGNKKKKKREIFLIRLSDVYDMGKHFLVGLR